MKTYLNLSILTSSFQFLVIADFKYHSVVKQNFSKLIRKNHLHKFNLK